MNPLTMSKNSDHGIVVGDRWAGFSFSHTTTSRGFGVKNKKLTMSSRSAGRNALLKRDVRGE